MDLGMKNKNALARASSRGLGKACAFYLVREGVKVVMNGRDATCFKKVKKEAVALRRGKVDTVCSDITTEKGRAMALDACPNPDILITNAGG